MPTQTPHSKRRSWTGLPTSIDLIDALPSWARSIIIVLGVVFFFYSVVHYGLGDTLLRVIFSP